ncbi:MULTISPECIES: universal stress protein [unclassified Meiothermus]|uniref:universal stress protein n=1 Tax=unclassified Meiothermus TaxID=370471 RepID=UPI000D7C7D71|nr:MULTISPECIES: universal stress protein [unclassified Meiothermus]PZA06384.1 universal stress protein [Meiothermus sp. Pnk-1]RYM36997.1 universal stress protein [Meiothermus sp. PNK-Is4]
MYGKILMPTDGSSCSTKAIEQGLELAKTLGAQVTFVYVVEDPTRTLWISPEAVPYGLELIEDLKKAGNEALEAALQMAARAGVSAQSKLREGKPIDAILSEAKSHDLIVMGTHGRSGIDRLLLGSVTEGVLHRSEKPVLVIRSH